MTTANTNKSTLFERMNSGFKEPARHFEKKLLPVHQIIRNDSTEGRNYTLPDGTVYPSVTTLLKKLPSPGLDAWRNRVGAVEAEHIKNVAAKRGSKLHEMVEIYLGGQPDATKGHMPINVAMFRSLKPLLDKIDLIYGIELPLYSHQIKSAGACDIFTKYSGKNSIIDIKNAKNPKTEDYILGYFLQTTAYSIMIEELYQMPVENIVILVAVENGETQCFIKNPNDYKDQVFDLFLKG